MYYQRNNAPFGRNNQMFGSSRYQYQTLPYGYEGTQASGLIGKVMGLLAFSFLFATIGTFIGSQVIHSVGSFWIVAIAGFVVLFILNFAIQKPGLNLFLLYLFTFLEGMSLSPLISYYLVTQQSNILGEAFLITTLTSFGLAFYAWTTKRDFSRLADYLFFGLILLIVTSLIGIFFGGLFHTTLFSLLIAFFGVAIFSGYVLYYVQRAKYMANTLPNAIGLTVSLFITVLNLFIYILEILSTMQGGRNRQ
ncbi:MAG: Bax inhibitor-1/YccA family protein [Chloroflexota bacterium]|nr:Bax inhibitor-1/YccA family protein [Chloroflexota bacterium]